jgi:hypothetical protein
MRALAREALSTYMIVHYTKDLAEMGARGVAVVNSLPGLALPSEASGRGLRSEEGEG